MRKLFFTTGSPFARAVRIVHAEKGLPFEREETFTSPSVEERAKVAPTLQVPTLIDGDLKLWDSMVIIEYQMTTYPDSIAVADPLALSNTYVRPQHIWPDKLVLTTLQTLGISTATVTQLQSSGVRHEQNSFANR